MQNSSSEDTSAYWRKLLKIDEPAPEGLLKKADGPLRIARPYFNGLIERLGKRLTGLSCTGSERLPVPPFIIASNHSSILDFPAVFFCLPGPMRNKMVAVYKSAYDRNPFTRFFIRLFTRSLPVDMDKKPWEALSDAAKVLSSGNCIYIAPEGTRSSGSAMLPFKPGVGALAVETATPVVPAFIKGADKVLPRGGILPKKGKITVCFGEPIDMSPFIKEKASRPAYDVYKEAAQKIRQEVLKLGE